MVCRICGNKDNNTSYEAREMMFGFRSRFTYFQCSVCKCLQIEKIPEDMAKYYPEDYNGFALLRKDYYNGLKGRFRKKRYEATLFHKNTLEQVFKTFFFAEQYQVLGKLSLSLETKILDMGCGTGNYLYPLYEMGMKDVSGADPFIISSIQYPNGYQVVKSFIHQLSGGWDVIIYNHSFEHVPDPLENLQSVERLLKPDGTCIIRIPTVSSFAWEYYGTDWFQLDAPRHFFLHSIESMAILAEKAGLQVIEVMYDSSAMQFIGSEKYVADIPLHKECSRSFSTFFQRKFQKWKYGRRAKALNLAKRGDQAAFFLRKKSG